MFGGVCGAVTCFVLLFMVLITYVSGGERAWLVVYSFGVVALWVPITCIIEYAMHRSIQAAPWLLFFAVPLGIVCAVVNFALSFWFPMDVLHIMPLLVLFSAIFIPILLDGLKA